MGTRIIYSLLILVATSCKLSAQMPQGKNIQIRIELDSSINDCEQKVYLHHYDNNDRIIDDSVTVEKGQKEITLYTYAQEERWFCILFSQKGPIDWFVVLAPNSSIKASISEADGISPSKSIKGADANNERVQKIEATSKLHQEKRNLHAELASPQLTDEESKDIIARIARIDAQIDSIEMGIIQQSRSSFNTIVSLKHFKEKVNKDSLTTLCNIALMRFPGNQQIERLIHPVSQNYPPESEESKIADKLIKDITNRRLVEYAKFSRLKQSSSKKAVNVNDITLLSDQNNKVSISELKGKIILIDFWASWCIPCLEEIPYIRQLQKLYGDKIKICLISIDKKHANWKKSIEKNRLHDFLNLTAVDDKENMNETIEAMNIGTIPYNIILNEKHQVIATDIHGKELLQKIDSLINQ